MNCTVLIHSRKLGVKGEQPPTQDDLCKGLESKDDGDKIVAAKQAILLLLNGEHLPRLPMTVIRFCINTKNKVLKKLVMLYWEIVEKFDSEGKLKPEMILVWYVYILVLYAILPPFPSLHSYTNLFVFSLRASTATVNPRIPTDSFFHVIHCFIMCLVCFFIFIFLFYPITQ
jgi:hypothetical protein